SRAAAGVDLDLERDAKLAAIAEYGLVMARDAGRAGVPIEVGIELTDLARYLARAVGHLDRVAAPDGPVAAADAVAGFEDCAGIAGLAELIGRGEAGDARTQDDHPGAVRAAWRERQRLGYRGGAKKAHRLHGEVGGPISASGRDPS